jgi:dTDP-glucose 4,6-dehydratase
VDNSIKEPRIFLETNIMGTYNLLNESLNYLRKNHVNKKNFLFIHISTDEVFGDIKDLKGSSFKETTRYNPQNPYSATKAAAEMLVTSYYHSFKLPVIITRGNNVYGPRQYPEKIIPAFISNLLNNKKCKIHGKGISRRNFIHVTDVCNAIDTILCKGKINEIYNIGTNNEYNVIEILQKLVAIIKTDSDYLQYAEFIEDRLFNDFRYCIDTNKLKELGWKEQIPFSKGLKDTINWYSDSNNNKMFSKSL